MYLFKDPFNLIEHLERAFSLFKKSLLPTDKPSIETINAFNNHNNSKETI
jgi:hypothetical protein